MAFEPGTGPGRRPNIVVVVLDCARSKSLALFGAGTAHCPTLTHLAHDGWATSRAIAPSNWTLPSHLAMASGTYPESIAEVRGPRDADRESGTIAERLQARGYESVLFSENAILLDPSGFARGYRVEHWPVELAAPNTRLGATREGMALRLLLAHKWGPVGRLVGELPEMLLPLSLVQSHTQRAHKRRVCNDALVEDFGRWLAGRARARPFHAFVNLVDAHEPYDLSSDLGARTVGEFSRVRSPICFQQAIPSLRDGMPWRLLEAAYARSLESADRKLGRLLELLARAGESDRTAVLVTGDHGQQFGEMGMVNHGSGATDAVCQVPLVTNLDPEVLGVRDGWVSLTRLPEWALRIADPDSSPAGRSSGRASDALAPRCVAAPASDLNPALRGIGGPSDRWNHRLEATFLDEGKLLVDATSSEVLWWPRSRDPDSETPQVLRLRPEEFRALHEALPTAAPVPHEPLDEPQVYDASVLARLAEWGYT